MINKQKGGKLIDSGSYGCINYPALHCWSKERKKSRKFENSNYVSKIMTTDESEYEIKNIKELKKLDYLDLFTLKNIKLCTPKEFNDKKDNLSKCNIISKKDINELVCKNKNLNSNSCYYTHILNPNYSLILMPKLKYTLYDLMLDVLDENKSVVKDGINLTLNLYYACAVLAQNSFLHFDIKENNFGFDGEKPVLFDFGLSFNFLTGKKLIYNPSQRISQSMDYYMYQHTSACGLDLSKSNKKEQLFLETDEDKKKEYNNLIKWISHYQDINDYVNLQYLSKIYNYTEKEYIEKKAKTLIIIYGYCLPTFNNSEKKWLANKILYTIDSYALGISLLFYLNIIKNYISSSLKNDLLEIVKYSCHFNVIERLWPSEIITKVDDLIKKHNLENKYQDYRKYKLVKNQEVPSRIKDVLKVLQDRL